ncbi:MAG: DUF362 domain-containing protein [Clostridia bacterium]|nr:DUF362 domain-containing protein [Clostridia bacterium]
MGKVKMILVYGAILGLCVAAIVGYFTSQRPSAAVSESKAIQKTESAQVQVKAADNVKAEEKPKEELTENIPANVQEKMKKATQIADNNPVVGIGRGKDFAKVTRQAIDNAGGLKGLIKPGNTVIIKPNMIRAAKPEAGIVTDYRVVQEIANIAKESGASRIIVADGSPWNKSFDGDASDYKTIQGVELLDFNDCKEEECYKLKPADGLTKIGYFIPKIYMDADVVISAAKLKTHPEATVTLSLKNVFGVPPANLSGVGFIGKGALHNRGIANSIIDLNMIRKPDFAVIDGIIGGEGNMPFSGTPINSEIVLAGKDPVATDTAALTFMGFKVGQVIHIRQAQEKGLGINDISKIKIVGADLEKIKMQFKKSESY